MVICITDHSLWLKDNSDPNEAPSVEFIVNLIAQREGGNAPGALNWGAPQ